MNATDTSLLVAYFNGKSGTDAERLARRTVLKKGFKARVSDALIAQSCIDHDVALITRDRDFRHFVTHCGLKLA